MTKPRVTRTYGPIHFEDLDPHRFEDLLRELIYDYKDWQTIEATGRSGSDDGFDIRAYEKIEDTSRAEKEEDSEVEEIHPMEGNLWMIQGKREREIGPKKVKSIIAEIDIKNPPVRIYIGRISKLFKRLIRCVSRRTPKKGSNGILSMGQSRTRGHAAFTQKRSDIIYLLWYFLGKQA